MGRPITKQEIEAQTKTGHPTKATLAEWGVPWPPPKGWKKALVKYGVPYHG